MRIKGLIQNFKNWQRVSQDDKDQIIEGMSKGIVPWYEVMKEFLHRIFTIRSTAAAPRIHMSSSMLLLALRAFIFNLSFSTAVTGAVGAKGRSAHIQYNSPKSSRKPHYDIPCHDHHSYAMQFVHIPKNAGTTIENIGRENGYCWGRFATVKGRRSHCNTCTFSRSRPSMKIC